MPELKTFIFTDLVRSVELKNEMAGTSATERDMAFVEQVLTPHRERIEAAIEAHGGRIVSTAGDGHFLVFSDTLLAARWAIGVQRSHRLQPIETPRGRPVEVRVSMHVGVPQTDPRDPDNFVGKPVDYAARLNDYATGGQILVSRSVMAILEDVGLDGVTIHAHGQRHLAGIGDVPVHELIYDDEGPRPTRQQPKAPDQRQWTVLPTDIGGGILPTTSASSWEHRQLGNYELGARLGSGGMGDVYRARHSQFGRLRAVKVIKPQFVDAGHEEIVRRFYQEIKAIGGLEHKNIVVAIDSSTPDDRVHYLVMEYIDGMSVLDLVERHGPLAVADACEITRQVARGLQYIHKNGMVHRDIKPSNLMLTVVDADQLDTETSLAGEGDGQRAVVKILDLGLALLVDDDERLTRLEQRAMGTGMYMSPEQWKTTSVDIRADIYSLGCTLYHLLAGNPPFHDSDLRPEKAHERLRLPPIKSGTHVSRKLWEVMRKMVAKQPGSRFQTPAEVAEAMWPFAEGHRLVSLVRDFSQEGPRSTAVLPTRPESSRRGETLWSRAGMLYPSRRWLVAKGLPLLGIAAAGGAAWWLLDNQNAQRRARLEASYRATLTGLAKDVAARGIGSEIATRFQVLTDSAQQPELLAALQVINAQRIASDADRQRVAALPESETLINWVKDRVHKSPDTRASSWFVTDRRGIQVARSPVKALTYLKSFAKRDYFHGRGYNLTTEEDIREATPIRSPNLSAVYKSSGTTRLKVAFSVPVWSQAATGQEADVIGVLAMSVELGSFSVENLQRDLTESNEVVLIDLRDDFLEDEARRGLILDHPRLNQRRRGEPPRIAAELLDEIQQQMTAAPSSASGRSKDLFIRSFRDRLSERDVEFCGAFQPVDFTLRDPRTGSDVRRSTDWIVLVQTEVLW